MIRQGAELSKCGGGLAGYSCGVCKEEGKEAGGQWTVCTKEISPGIKHNKYYSNGTEHFSAKTEKPAKPSPSSLTPCMHIIHILG